jgi:hypothetical protein
MIGQGGLLFRLGPELVLSTPLGADLCGLTTRPNGLVLRPALLRICCAEPAEILRKVPLTRCDGGRYWIRTGDLFGVKHAWWATSGPD